MDCNQIQVTSLAIRDLAYMQCDVLILGCLLSTHVLILPGLYLDPPQIGIATCCKTLVTSFQTDNPPSS